LLRTILGDFERITSPAEDCAVGHSKFDLYLLRRTASGLVRCVWYTCYIGKGREWPGRDNSAFNPSHRSRSQRPCNYSAAEKPDEFPSPHGIYSLAENHLPGSLTRPSCEHYAPHRSETGCRCPLWVKSGHRVNFKSGPSLMPCSSFRALAKINVNAGRKVV
jgi:hypothetical protein